MEVIPLSPFDTYDSLLLTFSLSNPPLFPNLLRLLSLSSSYRVENVVNFIISKPLSYWSESTKNFLINIYPRLTSKDIGMIILEKEKGPGIMSFLEGFDHNSFSHNDDPNDTLELYHSQIRSMMDTLQSNFKKIESKFSFLSFLPYSSLDKFIIDQIFVRIYISTSTTSIMELFDSMKVTENTVMIVLGSFFKVNEFMKNEIPLFLEDSFEEENINLIVRLPQTFVKVKVNQENKQQVLES